MIELSEAIIVAGQFPRNAKLYVKTLAELIDLGVDDYKAYRYYDGMIVFCIETLTHYIWKNKNRARTGEFSVSTSFTYQNGTIANGIDYSSQTYCFYPFNSPQVFQNTQNINLLLAQNRILSGGIKWLGGFNFESTIIKYTWGRRVYSIPAQSLTLQNLPSNPGEKKVFVFAVDAKLNEVVIIEGEEDVNAIEPNVNFERQIRICAVTVEEGESAPTGLSKTLVYNENLGNPTEWNGTTISDSGSTILLNFEDEFYDGALCCAFKGSEENDRFVFEAAAPVSVDDFDSLSFRLYNYDINPLTPYKLGLVFRQTIGGQAVGFADIFDGRFGLDLGNTSDWHLINVEKSQLDYSFSVNSFSVIELVIYREDNEPLNNNLILIDLIEINSGIQSNSGVTDWISLTDTYESTYSNKKGYISSVRNQEDGLHLKHPVLIPMAEQYFVRKANLETANANALEIGDEVYFRKITNDGDPKTLIGHTYNGGDEQLLASYTQNQSIEI